jgi:hypothetical protein
MGKPVEMNQYFCDNHMHSSEWRQECELLAASWTTSSFQVR